MFLGVIFGLFFCSNFICVTSHILNTLHFMMIAHLFESDRIIFLVTNTHERLQKTRSDRKYNDSIILICTLVRSSICEHSNI